MTKLLLTATEAAEMLGVGRSKLYELAASGQIETVKIGKLRRVPVEAVERYVSKLRSDPQIPESA